MSGTRLFVGWYGGWYGAGYPAAGRVLRGGGGVCQEGTSYAMGAGRCDRCCLLPESPAVGGALALALWESSSTRDSVVSDVLLDMKGADSRFRLRGRPMLEGSVRLTMARAELAYDSACSVANNPPPPFPATSLSSTCETSGSLLTKCRRSICGRGCCALSATVE